MSAACGLAVRPCTRSPQAPAGDGGPRGQRGRHGNPARRCPPPAPRGPRPEPRPTRQARPPPGGSIPAFRPAPQRRRGPHPQPASPPTPGPPSPRGGGGGGGGGGSGRGSGGAVAGAWLSGTPSPAARQVPGSRARWTTTPGRSRGAVGDGGAQAQHGPAGAGLQVPSGGRAGAAQAQRRPTRTAVGS